MRASRPRTRLSRRLAAFPGARSAVAAVEFALILPILVVFMLGGAEVARYIAICRSMTNLANSLATLVAERTTAYNFNDAVFTYYSAFVTMPFLLSDAQARGTQWNLDIGMTISSVTFTPTQSGCTSNCTYTGKVAWSVNSPIAVQRSCIVPPQPVSDTTPLTMLTLPQDVFTSGSVIVADVAYYYTPMFGQGIIPPILISRSFFLQPRYLPSIPYQSSGFDAGYVCP